MCEGYSVIAYAAIPLDHRTRRGAASPLSFRAHTRPHHCPSMDPSFWRALSLLGDSRFLLPAAVTLMLLGYLDGRRPYRRWSWGVGAVGVAVLASKLAYLGLGIGLTSPQFTGFSGHAAFSAAIWPVLLASATRTRQRGAAVSGLILAALVSASRPPLYTHSWTEVIAGWLLGSLAAVWALRGAVPADVRRLSWTIAALAVGSVTLATLWNVRPHTLLLLVTGHPPH
ncbi:phosphatase PAP2 family protein [Stenotrophomonas sp. 2619]|uniref:phosphatase PAP2 family protein n=1 Tax=Stenotrophomonas sp. 2619 TaxID=3156316 RepID=UPI0033920476